MYDRLADLPLVVEDLAVEQRRRDTSSGFERVTTTVTLRGDGAVGRGEDVAYEAEDHEGYGAVADRLAPELAGEYTHAGFSARLDGLSLWDEPPSRETFHHYRRWAFESAALDLALTQAGRSLGDVLDRGYDPVEFVVSTRLDEENGPPTADRVQAWLSVDPTLRFKLDPTPAWDGDLIATLQATDAVRIVDLKGHYEDTDVDVEPEAEFYERIVGGFPHAIVEDPGVTPATRPVLGRHEDRLSWDAPIESQRDVRSVPLGGRWCNVKPSRFGTVRSLLATIRFCQRAGIGLYGGGQFELGVGRGQLHELASLFYPDAPNDVAPGSYNEPEVHEDVPASPLEPPADHVGFGW